MKKINYLEGLRSKAQTSNNVRKIEQKRVETSVFSEDQDEDLIYAEPLLSDQYNQTTMTENSFSYENLSTTWGKENLSTKLDEVHTQNKYSSFQQQKPTHHTRTLSANIPYSNQGKAIHTNIGNLDSHKQQQVKQPLGTNQNTMNTAVTAQNASNYNSENSNRNYHSFKSTVEIASSNNNYHSWKEINEEQEGEDDEGDENIEEGDQEIACLQNFYTDLEK